MKLLFVAVALLVSGFAKAGPGYTSQLYNPDANAQKDIAAAVAKARAQKKFVMLQAGGNWCSWCKLFNKTVTEDTQLDSILDANFIVYHLNYSDENKNEAVFAKYGFPQRFGFPVFIILDEKGNRIHTQNSEYLEEGKGYNKKKVAEFFEAWAPAALDPAQYKESK
jgi:thioredoxin-related protein